MEETMERLCREYIKIGSPIPALSIMGEGGGLIFSSCSVYGSMLIQTHTDTVGVDIRIWRSPQLLTLFHFSVYLGVACLP
jgi:hypothetical protein